MLAMSVLREFMFSVSGNKETPGLPGMGSANICDTISYSKNGNNTYSVFMMTFTTVYLCMPMFVNSSVNWLFLGTCIAWILIDIAIRKKAGCVTSVNAIFTNIVIGLVMAMTIVGTMTANGSEKFLFFNEVQSNKVVCSRPKKQQFKCAVYKNGEVLTNTVV